MFTIAGGIVLGFFAIVIILTFAEQILHLIGGLLAFVLFAAALVLVISLINLVPYVKESLGGGDRAGGIRKPRVWCSGGAQDGNKGRLYARRKFLGRTDYVRVICRCLLCSLMALAKLYPALTYRRSLHLQ